MYQQKEFMTESEQYFYNILKEIETEYDVKIQPQINLASIIEKTTKHKYANELFRNVDKILSEANIKLIKFYTDYPNERLYVINRILDNLDLLI